MSIPENDVEELVKQINLLPPQKKQSLYTQILEELTGEEIQNLDLKISPGNYQVGMVLEPEEDLKIRTDVSFKNEIKANFSISKKF